MSQSNDSPAPWADKEGMANPPLNSQLCELRIDYLIEDG